jgi:hypothetical protein
VAAKFSGEPVGTQVFITFSLSVNRDVLDLDRLG